MRPTVGLHPSPASIRKPAAGSSAAAAPIAGADAPTQDALAPARPAPRSAADEVTADALSTVLERDDEVGQLEGATGRPAPRGGHDLPLAVGGDREGQARGVPPRTTGARRPRRRAARRSTARAAGCRARTAAGRSPERQSATGRQSRPGSSASTWTRSKVTSAGEVRQHPADRVEALGGQLVGDGHVGDELVVLWRGRAGRWRQPVRRRSSASTTPASPPTREVGDGVHGAKVVDGPEAQRERRARWPRPPARSRRPAGRSRSATLTGGTSVMCGAIRPRAPSPRARRRPSICGRERLGHQQDDAEPLSGHRREASGRPSG